MKIYRHMCDGSAGVAVDDAHFFAANDDDQTIRLYRNDNSPGEPLAAFNFSRELGADADNECDIEGAAEIDHVVYWITSHGRDKDGDLSPARHRLFATTLKGKKEKARLEWVGRYDQLAQDLCDISCWTTSDKRSTRRVVRAITRATRLEDDKVKKLAPKKRGLNIEGLAAGPGGILMIGLRNPIPGGRAIVIPLQNPAALISGEDQKARFGHPARLKLGGRGVRSLCYAPAIRDYVIIAGRADSEGPFRLYRWSGAPDDKPKAGEKLKEFDGFAPESIITYGESPRIQILGDGGSLSHGGDECKDRPEEQKFFTDRWRYLD